MYTEADLVGVTGTNLTLVRTNIDKYGINDPRVQKIIAQVRAEVPGTEEALAAENVGDVDSPVGPSVQLPGITDTSGLTPEQQETVNVLSPQGPAPAPTTKTETPVQPLGTERQLIGYSDANGPYPAASVEQDQYGNFYINGKQVDIATEGVGNLIRQAVTNGPGTEGGGGPGGVSANTSAQIASNESQFFAGLAQDAQQYASDFTLKTQALEEQIRQANLSYGVQLQQLGLDQDRLSLQEVEGRRDHALNLTTLVTNQQNVVNDQKIQLTSLSTQIKQHNADAQQRFSEFEATMQNRIAEFNANAELTVGLENARNELTVSLQNANQAFQAAQASADRVLNLSIATDQMIAKNIDQQIQIAAQIADFQSDPSDIVANIAALEQFGSISNALGQGQNLLTEEGLQPLARGLESQTAAQGEGERLSARAASLEGMLAGALDPGLGVQEVTAPTVGAPQLQGQELTGPTAVPDEFAGLNLDQPNIQGLFNDILGSIPPAELQGLSPEDILALINEAGGADLSGNVAPTGVLPTVSPPVTGATLDNTSPAQPVTALPGALTTTGGTPIVPTAPGAAEPIVRDGDVFNVDPVVSPGAFTALKPSGNIEADLTEFERRTAESGIDTSNAVSEAGLADLRRVLAKQSAERGDLLGLRDGGTTKADVFRVGEPVDGQPNPEIGINNPDGSTTFIPERTLPTFMQRALDQVPGAAHGGVVSPIEPGVPLAPLGTPDPSASRVQSLVPTEPAPPLSPLGTSDPTASRTRNLTPIEPGVPLAPLGVSDPSASRVTSLTPVEPGTIPTSLGTPDPTQSRVNGVTGAQPIAAPSVVSGTNTPGSVAPVASTFNAPDFGTAAPAQQPTSGLADTTNARSTLLENFRKALLKFKAAAPNIPTGPFGPSPVNVSAPGTDPFIQQAAAGLAAAGGGVNQGLFARELAKIQPRGVQEGASRRTA